MTTTDIPGPPRGDLVDLVERARSGIVIHLPLWIVLGLTSGLARSMPVFFGSIAALFGVAAALRFAFERRCAARAAARTESALAVRALVLCSPLQWGLLGACSRLWPPLEPVQMPLLIILSGIAAAGGMVLAIDSVVRIGYPLLTLAPTVLSLVFAPTMASAFLAGIALIFGLYVVGASKSVHADYWSAVTARAGLEERARELERLSSTDALTQVHNRQFLNRQLDIEWARAERDRRPLSLLMIDLDHFKRINDAHGHPFGDACLQAVARALQTTLQRPGDLVARYGGEEFIVLLPGIDRERAAKVAARLHRAVAAIELHHEGRPVRTSCSIGVHTVAELGECTAAAALAIADQALYRAKREGRDRVVLSA